MSLETHPGIHSFCVAVAAVGLLPTAAEVSLVTCLILPMQVMTRMQEAKQGKSMARMLRMAQAMLDAVQTFKMPGGPLRIRIGEHCACFSSRPDPGSPQSFIHHQAA